MIFLSLLIIPLLISLGFLWGGRGHVTWKEYLVHLAIQIAVAGLSVAAIHRQQFGDVEIWNGTVQRKASERVSCSHSYKCFCHDVCTVGERGSTSCIEVCQTCYDHPYDVSWFVQTQIGRFEISRVDRQGLREPPRWKQVQIGEPVSSARHWANYIKAAPDTLFRRQGLVQKYEKVLPAYPSAIYDYWKISRVLQVDGAAAKIDKAHWNQLLSEMNGRLGPTKQANVIVVFVPGYPQEFFYALEQHWLGGKQNDVIVVLSTADGETLNWAAVMSWTDRQILKVSLRNELLQAGRLDPETVLGITERQVRQHFVRKQFKKDFEYLASSATPSMTQFVIAALVGIISSLLVGWLLFKHDLFGEAWKRNRY